MNKVSSAEEVGKYLNQARQNPQSLIPHIQQQLSRFSNDRKMQLYPGMFYSTNQGKKVWEQTIAYLKSQQPIHPLQINKPLCSASNQHALDLAQHNMLSHTGSNGSSMSNRIKKYTSTTFTGSAGQNIGQGFKFQGLNIALQAVLSLIIDDGVPDRGHRHSIFNPKFKYFGSATHEGDQHYFTVIDYCSQDLQENGVLSPVDNKPNGQANQNSHQGKQNQHFNTNQMHYGQQNGKKRFPVQQKTFIKPTQNGTTYFIETTTHTKYNDGSEQTQTSTRTLQAGNQNHTIPAELEAHGWNF